MKSRIVTAVAIGIMLKSCLMLTGCSTIKKHIDLGDGQVLDVVPVAAVAAGANFAQPGAGKLVNAAESYLAGNRADKEGPFGGLPVATKYTLTLKTPATEGQTIIPHDQIGKIYRERSAIMPAPITDEVSVEQFFAQSTNSAGRWQAILEQIKTIQSNQAEVVTEDADPEVIKALTP